jgi:hypothetical protein
VAEDLLDLADVGAALEEVGGGGVPQGVRRDVPDPRGGGGPFDDGAGVPGAEPAAPHTEEHRRGRRMEVRAGPRPQRAGPSGPRRGRGGARPRRGARAARSAASRPSRRAGPGAGRGRGRRGRGSRPHRRAPPRRTAARGGPGRDVRGCRGVRRLEQPLDLVDAEHPGQVPSRRRALQERGHVAGDEAALGEEGRPGADRGRTASERRPGVPTVREVGEVPPQGQQLELVRVLDPQVTTVRARSVASRR